MKNRLLYISILAAAVLSSCAKEQIGEQTLSGTGEKTPIVVVSNVNANSSVTKAVDGRWEENDVFMAYIKHVTTTGIDPALAWQADVTGDGVGPRLANFKISGITQNYAGTADNFNDHTTTSTLTVTDAEGLYWDDFSNSVDAAHDLRTANHALMSFYGYCYNGGSPNSGTELDTDKKKANGAIGWTVAQNQTSGFKTSDLLFSGQQKPVAYSHGTASGISGRNKVLSIPYYHAMSKVTVVLKLEDGFSSDKENFASTTVTLQGMNTVSTVTAPTLSVAPVAGAESANVKNITAQPISTGATNLQKSFTALIAPTVMKADKVLAKIVNIDSNDYELKLTDAVLTAASDPERAWSTKLAAHDATSVAPTTEANYSATDGGLTLPGVHYIITVTIKKQQIKVEATINDWDTVNAEGIGQIQFATDVKTIITDPESGLTMDASFDLYKKLYTADTYGVKATTVTWNTDPSGHWSYDPAIYWQNSSDKEYFRALSPAGSDLNVEVAEDILWGTTAKHSGKDIDDNDYSYGEGDAINPRTMDVPLIFKHAMSKISFILTTTTGDDKVDLDDANISIINTYNKGTMDLHTGDIGSLVADPAGYIFTANVDSDHKLLNNVVVPQSLVNDKSGIARETMPSYYQLGELTLIYNDGKSLPEGGGDGEYYVTSTLDRVNYSESELTRIYQDGTSIVPEGENPPYETYITSSLTHVPEVEAVNYTAEEVEEINAPYRTKVSDSGGREPGEDGYVDTWILITDINGVAPGGVGYITTYKYPQDYTPITTDDIKIPAVPEHYKLNETSVQATTETFHYYKKKDGEASEQHNPGDYKTYGDKIMLYITLADKTRYVLELSSCMSGEGPVTEWKRGEHYTYTISLAKEQITFRALIKDWDEKTGSGNATLEWD